MWHKGVDFVTSLGRGSLRRNLTQQETRGPFCRQHFNSFSFMIILIFFVSNFTKTCSSVSSYQQTNVCSDNGSEQNRRQSIIWTNVTLSTYAYLRSGELKGFRMVLNHFQKYTLQLYEKRSVTSSFYETDTWRRCDMKVFFLLLTICDEHQLVIGGFPTQSVSNGNLCYPEQNVEQTMVFITVTS